MPTDLQFHPLVIALFWRQVHERLLYLKQPGAVTLAGSRQILLPFLCGQLQRFVKFLPGTDLPPECSPAACGTPGRHPHAASQRRPREKPVLHLSAGLVLIQDNMLFGATAGLVEQQ